MGALIARQPNGRICRFSSIVDSITDHNLTDEEYIEMCAEEAREEARRTLENRLKPFEDIVERMNQSVEFGYADMDEKGWKELLETMSATPGTDEFTENVEHISTGDEKSVGM